MTKAPANPNRDDENAVPMPDSGASRLVLIVLNASEADSPDTFSARITSPTAPTVLINPQNVPSNPKKVDSPIK